MHVEGGDEKERQYKRRGGGWERGIRKSRKETLYPSTIKFVMLPKNFI